VGLLALLNRCWEGVRGPLDGLWGDIYSLCNATVVTGGDDVMCPTGGFSTLRRSCAPGVMQTIRCYAG
jgi:hypothetical protein